MQPPLLTDYICTIHNAISDGDCDMLIAQFDTKPHERVDTDTYHFDVINCNTTEGLGQVAFDIATLTQRYATGYFNQLGLPVTPDIQGYEQVRLKRYVETDGFTTHIDVGNYESARRYLICLYYLNDFEGGETIFESLGFEIRPKKGMLAMFPPFWMFPHAGKRPMFGNKYTIATSLHYL